MDEQTTWGAVPAPGTSGAVGELTIDWSYRDGRLDVDVAVDGARRRRAHHGPLAQPLRRLAWCPAAEDWHGGMPVPLSPRMTR